MNNGNWVASIKALYQSIEDMQCIRYIFANRTSCQSNRERERGEERKGEGD